MLIENFAFLDMQTKKVFFFLCDTIVLCFSMQFAGILIKYLFGLLDFSISDKNRKKS